MDTKIEINKRFGTPFYIPLIALVCSFLLSSALHVQIRSENQNFSCDIDRKITTKGGHLPISATIFVPFINKQKRQSPKNLTYIRPIYIDHPKITEKQQLYLLNYLHENIFTNLGKIENNFE